MAQRVQLQLNSVIAQSSLPKTQRGQSENTSQVQLKLVQKSGSAADNHSNLRSAHREDDISNAATMQSRKILSNGAQASSIHDTAAATANMAHNPMSIVIDDSMLLNLLKQIVDSEFSKSRSPIATHDKCDQDSEIQIKRDAVFGVLRSALDVGQQSSQEQVEVHSSNDLRESSNFHAPSDTVKAATLASRVEFNQPVNTLIQEASRLASIVKSFSPSSVTRTNFLAQTWKCEKQINFLSIVWRLSQQFGKTVQNNDRLTKDVVGAPVLASIQENDYGTAPLWYQQDMENGPPPTAFSSTQRTWRES